MISLLSVGRIARTTRGGGALRHAPQCIERYFQPVVGTDAASSSTSSCCWYSTSRPTLGLEEFRDSVPMEKRMQENVGRSWTVKELRRKSFDDLWKLWLVLYKERNMLLTEKQILRRRNLEFPQADRWRKVKKSMGAIRHVMGDRKKEKIAEGKQKSREQEEELKNQSAFDEALDMEEDSFDADEEFDEGKNTDGQKTK